jgi:hypothetical protein
MKAGALLFGSLLLAAAAPASAPLDHDLAKRLARYTALPAQTCISRQLLDGPATYSGAVVYGTGRRLYVNRFQGGCHLAADDALTVEQFGGQLCRGDHATPFVASTGTVRPTCIFGAFEPFERNENRRRSR